MVLLGGLTPIKSRLVLDALTLTSLLFCTHSPVENVSNGVILVAAILMTIGTAGLTCRWTLTFPMVPIVLLQSLRRLESCSGPWVALAVTILSTLFIVLAALLSVLFPAIQLPPIQGEYNVGIVKLHLPVNLKTVYNESSSITTAVDDFVSVRILYPTEDETTSLPYLDSSIALDYCKETIAFGAPSPLKQSGWLLHNLRLIQMPLAPNAEPLQRENKLPIVIYSHGLGGTATTYTYQTQHLAAQGYVVLVLDHTDGSAPIVRKRDGTKRTFDYSIGQMWKDGKHVEYVRKSPARLIVLLSLDASQMLTYDSVVSIGERRARTDHRVQEFLASAIALMNLNEHNIPELESVGVSFVNRLDPGNVHFMGHSFGACTALTAAARRPHLASSVVAHEPVVDWMPDDARRELFPEHKLVGGPRAYDGGTGGYCSTDEEEEKKEADISRRPETSSTLHDVPMLFLYSDEWKRQVRALLPAMHVYYPGIIILLNIRSFDRHMAG